MPEYDSDYRVGRGMEKTQFKTHEAYRVTLEQSFPFQPNLPHRIVMEIKRETVKCQAYCWHYNKINKRVNK